MSVYKTGKITAPMYSETGYLLSNANCYIDTLYKVTANTEIRVVFSVATPSAERNYIFGCYTDGGDANRWQYSYSNNRFLGVGHIYYSSAISADTKIHSLIFNASKQICDDNTTTITSTSFKPDNQINLYIFGCNTPNGIGYTSSGVKIYSFQIYENGTLVRDMIPSIKDGKYGLIDTLTNTFYGNTGTGSFSGNVNSSTSMGKEITISNEFIEI